VDTNRTRSVIEESTDTRRTRRRWSVQEKLRIVLETLEPGVSVPVVARRHSVNANQLFIWRGQHRRGELIAPTQGERPARLLSVQIGPRVADDAEAGNCESREPAPVGCMEIRFPGGQHVTVRGRIDAKALRVLVRELSRPC
jgi:transposase-like protein